jgi:3-methyl-2-oxobutanoate hydroxymethyltransferase
MKGAEAISMITAYDAPGARIAAAGGMDIILVGDSVAQVVHGHDSTVPATMAMMELHCQAVRRGLGRQGPLVVGDLPFGSYITVENALKSSLQLVKEGGVDAVKLEGGLYTTRVIDQVMAVVQAGIPVMGHIGLTPQTAASLGGYKVQGQAVEPALRLVEEAIALEQAGVFAIVAEMVPTALAQTIAQEVAVPVIGIGAGLEVDGQVLVYHDVMGMFEAFRPRFMKEYVAGGELFRQGIQAYNTEVKQRLFPVKGTHDFRIKSDVIAEVRAALPSLRQRMALGQPTRRHLSTTAVAHRQSIADTQRPLSVAVIGGGAMGSLLTARLGLGQTASQLNMITGWPEQIQALAHSGLELVDKTSSATAQSVLVPSTSFTVINGLDEHRYVSRCHPCCIMVVIDGLSAVAWRALEAWILSWY